MAETARSNRYHIGIFGRRNAGKSSLINAIAGQDVSIISDVAGTTTDTVWKNIELPGIGAAVIADTAGYDDCGELGEKRVQCTLQATMRTDLALMLLDGTPDNATQENEWLQHFSSLNIPIICLAGKSDCSNNKKQWEKALEREVIPVSAKTGEGIENVLNAMAAIYKSGDNIDDITHSLAKAGDTVVLVMPQDAQAPQGRLIQPQVQTLRNLLDKHCLAMCCTPEHLPQMLASLTTPPSLIITDSQVFAQVEQLTPPGTMLTSFSILMARHKGDSEEFRARVCAAFESIVNNLIHHGDTEAVVCTHGGVITMLMQIYGLPKLEAKACIAAAGQGFTLRVTPSIWMSEPLAEVLCMIPWEKE